MGTEGTTVRLMCTQVRLRLRARECPDRVCEGPELDWAHLRRSCACVFQEGIEWIFAPGFACDSLKMYFLFVGYC